MMDKEVGITRFIYDKEECQSELLGSRYEVEEHIKRRYARAVFPRDGAMHLGSEGYCADKE